MSTPVQIESAVAGQMDSPQKVIAVATCEALKAFRQLQAEVTLTADGAAAWKESVADAWR